MKTSDQRLHVYNKGRQDPARRPSWRTESITTNQSGVNIYCSQTLSLKVSSFQISLYFSQRSQPVQGWQAAPIQIGGTLLGIQSPGAPKQHHFGVIFKCYGVLIPLLWWRTTL